MLLFVGDARRIRHLERALGGDLDRLLGYGAEGRRVLGDLIGKTLILRKGFVGRLHGQTLSYSPPRARQPASALRRGDGGTDAAALVINLGDSLYLLNQKRSFPGRAFRFMIGE